MNSLRTGGLAARGRAAMAYATLLAGMACVAAPVPALAVAPSFARPQAYGPGKSGA